MYRVLIVDDEELIRKGLRARIEYFRFPDLEIAEAGSSREALEMFRQTEYAMALVDICMPDMNGLEMIEQAQAIRPRTQFLLLSGFAEFSYAQQAIRLGVRAYLNKPVSNEVLRAQLDELLAELHIHRRIVMVVALVLAAVLVIFTGVLVWQQYMIHKDLSGWNEEIITVYKTTEMRESTE